MSDLELAVRECKSIETILVTRFGASGRGLHDKVTSVQGQLPDPLVRQLRYIATMRNKLVHEADVERLDDPAGYRRACAESRAALDRLRPAPGRPKAWAFVAAVVFIAAVLGYFFLRSATP